MRFFLRDILFPSTLESAAGERNTQNHQHQMIIITNYRSLENHLFNESMIRLFIISALGGWGTQSNITHFVWGISKVIPSHTLPY